MEGYEENWEGNPGISLNITGMKWTLKWRIMDLCIKINDFFRKDGLTVDLKEKDEKL